MSSSQTAAPAAAATAFSALVEDFAIACEEHDAASVNDRYHSIESLSLAPHQTQKSTTKIKRRNAKPARRPLADRTGNSDSGSDSEPGADSDAPSENAASDSDSDYDGENKRARLGTASKTKSQRSRAAHERDRPANATLSRLSMSLHTLLGELRALCDKRVPVPLNSSRSGGAESALVSRDQRQAMEERLSALMKPEHPSDLRVDAALAFLALFTVKFETPHLPSEESLARLVELLDTLVRAALDDHAASADAQSATKPARRVGGLLRELGVLVGRFKVSEQLTHQMADLCYRLLQSGTSLAALLQRDAMSLLTSLLKATERDQQGDFVLDDRVMKLLRDADEDPAHPASTALSSGTGSSKKTAKRPRRTPKTMSLPCSGDSVRVTTVLLLQLMQAVPVADAEMYAALLCNRLVEGASAREASSVSKEYVAAIGSLVSDLLVACDYPEWPAAEMLLLGLVGALSNAEPVLPAAVDALGKVMQRAQEHVRHEQDFPGYSFVRPQHADAAAEEHPGAEGDDAATLPQHDANLNNTVPADMKVACGCQLRRGDLFYISCDVCKLFHHGKCVGVDEDRPPLHWTCAFCQVIEDLPTDDIRAGSLLLIRKYLRSPRSSIEPELAEAAGRFHRTWLRKNIADAEAARGDDAEARAPEAGTSDEIGGGEDDAADDKVLDVSTASDYHFDPYVMKFVVWRLALLRPNGVFSNKASAILLKRVLGMLSAPSAHVRVKAIKALTDAVELEPELIKRPDVKAAVESRLTESATSVREAALETVGKHMVHTGAAAEYFENVVALLSDSGVSVRKRAVAILRDVLVQGLLEDNPDGRLQICIGLVGRLLDKAEEDSIKERIRELFLSYWFHPRGGDPEEVKGHVLSIVDLVAAVPTYDWLELLMKDLLQGGGGHEAASNATASQGARALARLQTQDSARATCETFVDMLVAHLVDLQSGSAPMIRNVSSVGAMLPLSQMAATMSTLRVLCVAHHAPFERHVETIAGFLAEGAGDTIGDVADHDPIAARQVMQESAAIVAMTLRASSRKPTRSLVEKLQANLTKLVQQGPRAVLTVSAECLCVLAVREAKETGSKSTLLLLRKMLSDYLLYLDGTCHLTTFADQGKRVVHNVLRACALCGLLCQNYNFDRPEDAVLMDDGFSEGLEHGRVLAEVHDVLCYLVGSLHGPVHGEADAGAAAGSADQALRPMAHKDDSQIVIVALHALFGVYENAPHLLTTSTSRSLLASVLGSPSAKVREAVLLGMQDLLCHEEKRADGALSSTQRGGEFAENHALGIDGDELEAAARVHDYADKEESQLSVVVQSHTQTILAMLCDGNERVRFAAIWLLDAVLRQRLMNPQLCVQNLVVLVADDGLPEVRHAALRLLDEMIEKSATSVVSRLLDGMCKAHELSGSGPSIGLDQNALQRNGPGGWSLFQPLYARCLGESRKSRGSLMQERAQFFTSVFALFDRAAREGGGASGSASSNIAAVPSTSLLRFLATVLATLRYTYWDEPLQIIWHVGRITSLRAEDVSSILRKVFQPLKKEKDVTGETLDKAVGLAREAGLSCSDLVALCRRAQVVLVLLSLKQFVRGLYDVKDDRILAFKESESSARALNTIPSPPDTVGEFVALASDADFEEPRELGPNAMHNLAPLVRRFVRSVQNDSIDDLAGLGDKLMVKGRGGSTAASARKRPAPSVDVEAQLRDDHEGDTEAGTASGGAQWAEDDAPSKSKTKRALASARRAPKRGGRAAKRRATAAADSDSDHERDEGDGRASAPRRSGRKRKSTMSDADYAAALQEELDMEEAERDSNDDDAGDDEDYRE